MNELKSSLNVLYVAVIALLVSTLISAYRAHKLTSEVENIRIIATSALIKANRPDTVRVEVPVEKVVVIYQQPKRMKKTSEQERAIERLIFETAIKQGVDSSMSRILVAIAKHESASFSSGLFNSNNNLFGMTWPPGRQNKASGFSTFLDNGNKRRFCSYATIEDSVEDMVMYLNHWKYPLNIQTPEEMVRTMKSKRYFEAPESLYLKAVKKHLKHLSV